MNDKLKRLIGRQKKLVVGIVKAQDKKAIGHVEKVAKECSLVASNFKCQKCKREKDLQYHHLIGRPVKNYVDFWRYASQRYYWANIIILCRSCHKQFHKVLSGDEEMLCIPEETIKKLKEKYGNWTP